MEKYYWYAVMRDNDDHDWGTGSFDLGEALAMARNYRENLGHPEAYIAVIDEAIDPYCVKVIRDIDSPAKNNARDLNVINLQAIAAKTANHLWGFDMIFYEVATGQLFIEHCADTPAAVVWPDYTFYPDWLPVVKTTRQLSAQELADAIRDAVANLDEEDKTR